VAHRGQFNPCCGLADSNNNIERTKLGAQLPKNFSNGALHQGTRNRARGGMPAYNDTQSGQAGVHVTSAQDDKIFSLPSRSKRASEMHASRQPRLARKTVTRWRLQTASRARPLARRALMTARPPRVFMRSRKPCVRARRVLEGWYVRFMAIRLR
jgi:hypothetical protein